MAPRRRIEISTAVADAYLFRCFDTGKPPLVKGLARELGVSSVALTRRFKEVAGVPLSQYLSDRRHELTLKLLAESDLKTEAVASQRGYRSKRSFHRSFSKKQRTTPTRYRKDFKTSPK